MKNADSMALRDSMTLRITQVFVFSVKIKEIEKKASSNGSTLDEPIITESSITFTQYNFTF